MVEKAQFVMRLSLMIPIRAALILTTPARSSSLNSGTRHRRTIKQIGLFMIVTQTFIHVAAGKQYEKYVKIIAGVIVLLLFVRPFSSSEGDIIEQWQDLTA